MEEVEIKNVGGPKPRDGVASEATLAELLEAVKNSTGNKTVAARAQTRAVENFNNSLRTSTDRQGLLSKAVSATEAALDLFQDTLKNNSKRLSEFTESIIGNSNFVFRTINRFNYAVDENVDRFRSLSETGASFNNSLFEMVSSAVDGGMSIEEFSDVVIRNAEVLRSLSGTVTEGSKRFANLSRQLRGSPLGRELYTLGFTFNEINETLLNYIDISRRSMLNERLSDSQLLAGTQAYAYELERLTKITGMTRSQAQAAMSQQMRDQRIRMQMAGMGEDERARFQANMAYLDTQVSGMGEVFRQLGNMDPGDELTRMLQIFAPDLAAGARDIQNMTTSELHNFIAGFGDQIDNLAAGMGEEQVAYLYRTNSVFREMFDMASQANRLSALTDEEARRLESELAARSGLTETFTYFEEQFRQITSEIMGSFFDTASMTGGFNDALSELASAFFELISPTDGAVTTLTGSLTEIIRTAFGPDGSIVSGIRGFTSFLEKPETRLAFANFVERIKDFTNGIVEFLFGTTSASEETGERTLGLFQRLYTMFSDVFSTQTTFTGMIVEGFRGIINSIGEAIIEYFEITPTQGQGPWDAIFNTVLAKILSWAEGSEVTDTTDFFDRLLSAAGQRILDFFNAIGSNEQLQAEGEAIARYWDELTTSIGNALLRTFNIERAVTGPGEVESFWAAMFRSINETLFGYIETMDSPAGTVEVRRSGLIDTVIDSIRNMFEDDRIVNSIRDSLIGVFNTVSGAFNTFWTGETGQALQQTIQDFFRDLVQTVEDMFVNSTLLNTLLGIDREEVAARQAETARETREQGRVPTGFDYENAIVSLLGEGLFNLQDIQRFNARSQIGDDLSERLLQQLEGMSRWDQAITESGRIRQGLDIVAERIRSGEASDEDRRLIEEVTAQIYRDARGFNQGTIGFENFGRETLVKLHGQEAVVPRDTVQGDILSDFYAYQTGRQPAVVNAFASIERKLNSALSQEPEVNPSSSEIGSLMSKIVEMTTVQPTNVPAVTTATEPMTQTQLVNKIDELNKTMLQVVSIMNEELYVQKRTMRGVHGMGSDLMKGMVR